MVMKSILIVSSIYFELPRFVGDYQIRRVDFVKRCNMMQKILRSILLRLNLGTLNCFFNIDKAAEEAAQSHIVILFDSSNNRVLTKFATKIEGRVNLSKTQLKFYFWNTVNSLKGLKISSHWELLSYDKVDCLRYNFRYVGSFYHLINNLEFCSEEEIVTDLYFVGTNKGRFSFVKLLEKKLQRFGVNTYFVYVSSLRRLFSNKYAAPISYESILGYAMQSKALLDVTRKGQFGLTLRFLEAMYLGKKLVTNNLEIVKYKLYDSSRILIVDTNVSALQVKKFIESDFVPYEESIKKIYSFEMWIQRTLDSAVKFDDTNIDETTE